MLRAVVRDLSRLDDVEEVAALVSPELAGALREISPKVRAETGADRDTHEAFRRFDALVKASSRVLIIAPEIDGALLSLSERVLAGGGSLLGCLPAGVRVAADKLECGRWLERAGIPTPLVIAWPPDSERDSDRTKPSFPAVLRPRHGAGSIATFRVESPRELERHRNSISDSPSPPDRVLSPFVEGLAASVSFIITDSRTIELAPGEQAIERRNGSVSYHGGRVPLPSVDLCRRAIGLGRRAVDALPGLGGFVGVDLILADDPRDDVVLEINPRLTTSYLGLRRFYRPCNLAEWFLNDPGVSEPEALCAERAVMRGPVVFGADESGVMSEEVAP